MLKRTDHVLVFLIMFFLSGPSQAKVLIEPFLYDLTDNSIRINAVTTKADDVLSVQCGGREFKDDSGEKSALFGFVYSVKIEGLTAYTSYKFSVLLSKKKYDGSFKTAPSINKADEVKFCVWGDTQTLVMNYKAAEKMLAWHPDFLLHVGDMPRGDGRKWQEWKDYFFDPAALLLRNSPVFPVPGNHEKGSPYINELFPLLSLNSSVFAGSGTYSFNIGNAHFTTVHLWQDPSDKNADISLYNKTPEDEKKIMSFLSEDSSSASAKSAKWRIMYMHMPPDHENASKGTKEAWKKILPFIKEYNPQIIFFGHKHIFRNTRNIIVDNVDSGIKGITTGLYWSDPEDAEIQKAPSANVSPSFLECILNKGGDTFEITPEIWDKEKQDFLEKEEKTVIKR